MTKDTKYIINRILFYAVLAIVSIYLLFPFYWAINSSFKTENQLQMTPATFLPRDPATNEISFSLRNYQGCSRTRILVAVSLTAPLWPAQPPFYR